MPLLFSYGTLQHEQVQLDSFGRLLNGISDSLPGYKLELLQIKDEKVLASSKQEKHPIAIKTNNPDDHVEGMLFEITEEELRQADSYEVDDYVRVNEALSSGKEAWVYVRK